MSIRGNGKPRNSEPSPWFKETIAEIKEMQKRADVRVARAEDQIELMKRDLAESKRQTREIIAECARMDAARSRDTAMIARILEQHNLRLDRIEKRR